MRSRRRRPLGLRSKPINVYAAGAEKGLGEAAYATNVGRLQDDKDGALLLQYECVARA